MFGVIIAAFLCSSHPLSDAEKVERAVKEGLRMNFPLHYIEGKICIEKIGEGNEYVERAITDYFIEKGVDVMTGSEKDNPVLTYSVERLKVSYKPLFPSLLRRNYEREIDVGLLLTLRKGKRILWTDRFSEVMRDKVGEDDLKRVWSRGISPEVPPSSTNIVESIMMSILVGALILGLYSGGK